jgi:hypothetical protein
MIGLGLSLPEIAVRGDRNAPTRNWNFAGLSFPTDGMTFARATNATVTDHRGVVWTAASGEMRIQGARRVENLIIPSEIYSTLNWTVASCTIVSAGPSVNRGALFTFTATASSNACRSSRQFFAASGRPLMVSVVAKAGTAGGAGLSLSNGGGGNVCYVKFNLLTGTVAGTGGTVTASGITDLGNGEFLCWMLAPAPQTDPLAALHIWEIGAPDQFAYPANTASGVTTQYAAGAQVELAAPNQVAPSEYVSCGVLSSPFHGYFADGVRYFSTERHVNYVPNSTFAGQTGGNSPPTTQLAGTSAFITQSAVTGSGIEDGLPYIDISFTVNNTSGSPWYPYFNMNFSSRPDAMAGQTWYAGIRARIVSRSGTSTNPWILNLREETASGTYITQTEAPAIPQQATLAALTCQKTITAVNTAKVLAFIATTVNNGLTDTITIRIAAPYLNRDVLAPYIPTSGVAAAGSEYQISPSGVLIEEGTTNQITNSTMVGAVVGSPGTIPTGWIAGGGINLTSTVVATGFEQGVPFMDVRFQGTPTNTFVDLAFRAPTVPAAASQTWTARFWVRMVGGSTANTSSVTAVVPEHDSGLNYLRETGPGVATSSLAGGVAASVTNATTTGVNTAFVGARFRLTYTADTAIDITLRISMPQLEQKAFATSFVPTTDAAATRNADDCLLAGPLPWFNLAESTIVAEGSTQATDNLVARCIVGFGESGISTNRVEIRTVGAPGGSQVSALVVSGGAVQFSGPTMAAPASRAALAFALNNGNATINGNAPGAPDTTLALPSVIAQARIGARAAFSGGEALNGPVRRIRYWPRRLPDATLQALTT